MIRYEGVADVGLGTDSGKIDFSGYFEAAQFPSGRLIVNVVPTNRPSLTGEMSSSDSSIQLSLPSTSTDCESLDGWTIACDGQNNFSPFNWALAPMVRQPAEHSFGPQYLVAKRKEPSVYGYPKAQFHICNFLWDDAFNNQPEALELRALSYRISIDPVEDYMDVAVGIRNSQGTEPTALVTIETEDSSLEPLESFRDLMDDLVYILRLSTGNLVTWYYGEVFDERQERPVERIHQQAHTRPYSNTIKFRPLRRGQQSAFPKVNLQELTESFFNEPNNILDKGSLKALINQFTNTCDQTNYLEIKGLLAATLTDLLASKLAHQRGTSETIPKAEYKAVHLPLLKEFIEKTDWPSFVKQKLKDSLRGVYRASFRRRLRELNKFLGMRLRESHISRIVEARNTLVHEVKYKSTFEELSWVDEYRFVTWTNLCALYRLTGYQGELPIFEQNPQLEV